MDQHKYTKICKTSVRLCGDGISTAYTKKGDHNNCLLFFFFLSVTVYWCENVRLSMTFSESLCLHGAIVAKNVDHPATGPFKHRCLYTAII